MKEIIEIPFCAKDSELCGWEYTIPVGFAASIENGKIIVKKEDTDEKIRKEITELVMQPTWETEKEFHRRKELCVWLKKQGEQKPTDKIKPKFKIGDYLVNDYCRGKVIALTDDAYLLDTEQGIPFSYEHNAHLWTIQDAKKGDVLVRNEGIKSICIFSHFDGILDKYESFTCYCGIEGEGLGSSISINGYHDDSKDYIPATKEQRNLLFQKIKEAGYEWDGEKKELKIIDWSKHIKYESNSPSIFTKESNWSEEDEKMLKSIIATCELAEQDRDSSPARHLFEMQSNWLKSIKERLNGENEKVMTEEEKELLLKDLEWCDMETNECHCYNCKLFDIKNNVCKCIDLCKRPTSTFKGFYKKW